MVTALSDHGEGYKCEPPFMVQTLESDPRTEARSLYVWGNNSNSEIGLGDHQVAENISFYNQCVMRKVIRNDLFEQNSVLSIAAGNTTSLFLIVDKQNYSQQII